MKEGNNGQNLPQRLWDSKKQIRNVDFWIFFIKKCLTLGLWEIKKSKKYSKNHNFLSVFFLFDTSLPMFYSCSSLIFPYRNNLKICVFHARKLQFIFYIKWMENVQFFVLCSKCHISWTIYASMMNLIFPERSF